MNMQLSRRSVLFNIAVTAGVLALPDIACAKTRTEFLDEIYRAEHAYLSKRHGAPLPVDVPFDGAISPGRIIIDQYARRVGLVTLDKKGKQIRIYPAAVGEERKQMRAGKYVVNAKKAWADWAPPPSMIKELRTFNKDVPSFMEGGPTNPLGARTIYLAGTLDRIHGTNQPEYIKEAISFGCIRLNNEDAIDLYERVKIGAIVQAYKEPIKLQDLRNL